MIFSVYLVKMTFIFPSYMILPFCHKSKDDLLPKKCTKMTCPISLKKVIFIIEYMNTIYRIYDRKMKDDMKVYF